MKEFLINSEDQLKVWIPVFYDLLEGKKKVAFVGDLGAGKTTLIKLLCQYLGVREQVVSPTFSLINEYSTEEDERIYHIDLYRLEKIEEALQIGIEEYLDSDAYVFIEWPQLIEDLLGDDFVQVEIQALHEQGRKIVIL